MHHKFISSLFLIICLAACGTSLDSGESPVATDLRPYSTSTTTPTEMSAEPTIAEILPTATLFIYVVEPNDTMIGIADQFGITLDELAAANLDKNPQFLTPGDQLIIPLEGNVPSEPTPTSVPIAALGARCYPTVDGGLWCYALVHNDYADTLENLSVRISLIDPSGQEITNQEAFGMLNILSPGETMPLAVYFTPPVDQSLTPRSQLLTAIRILADDPRYVPVQLDNTAVNIDRNGLTAGLSGQVVSLSSAVKAGTVWILGIAYDQAGNVVGLRRWENDIPLEPGESIHFEFVVSSVAGEISGVEFLAEARR